jgi:hypothetical protein
MEEAQPKKLADAMRRWKRFLLDKESVLGPFTQHLFIVVDQQHGRKRTARNLSEPSKPGAGSSSFIFSRPTW